MRSRVPIALPSDNQYSGPCEASDNWNTTETVTRVRCGITPFTVTSLVGRASLADNGRVVAVRKNAADEGPLEPR